MCLSVWASFKVPSSSLSERYPLPLHDIIQFLKARSVLFHELERPYISLNKWTMDGLLGISNFEKFAFKIRHWLSSCFKDICV